jgi:hypothetical protein
MKNNFSLGRKVVLGATVIAIVLLIIQRHQALPILNHYALSIRIFFFVMMCMTAWVMFGGKTISSHVENTKESPARTRGINWRMLIAGMGGMIIALIFIFNEAGFVSQLSPLGVTLFECVSALLFAGGFALVAWAILRPNAKR